MARGGVNKAVVQAARLAILARGEHPSIDAVRIEMGNTGSKTTIHRYLKELDDSDPQGAKALPGLDEELAELVNRLAQRLQAQAREPLERAEALQQAERLKWQAQLAEQAQALAQLQRQFEIQAMALAQESASLQAQHSMLQAEQTRNAGLSQACSDYELRLQDKDQQIRSLEDKHQHARDALEHFRNAARDQREQEHSRHESQVQQVQMELRQAQQGALVRQDEITQLHRDNERLITQHQASAKEARRLEEQLNKAGQREDVLASRALQLESQHALLQERWHLAQEQAQLLLAQVNGLQASNQALVQQAKDSQAALDQANAALAIPPAPSTTP